MIVEQNRAKGEGRRKTLSDMASKNQMKLNIF